MKKYTKTLVTSDWHLNHKRIRDFCPESRGHLMSIDDMNEALLSNHASMADEETITYILGDFVFGDKKEGINFLRQMPGHKVLIEGNHDHRFLEILREQPKYIWDEIGLLYTTPYKEIGHNVDGKNYQVCMFHFPIRTGSWHGSGNGSIQLHGHLHSPKNQPITHRQMDIGVDSNDLYPYDLGEVIKKLSVMPTGGHHGD